jgi:hypothetical protein
MMYATKKGQLTDCERLLLKSLKGYYAFTESYILDLLAGPCESNKKIAYHDGHLFFFYEWSYEIIKYELFLRGISNSSSLNVTLE